MNFYKNDHTIKKALRNNMSPEQKKLKNFVGQDFEQKEAKYVWGKIQDHKWYMSESLDRDIGLRVAAVDYIENYHESSASHSKFHNTDNFVFLLLALFLYLYSICFLYLLSI